MGINALASSLLTLWIDPYVKVKPGDSVCTDTAPRPFDTELTEQTCDLCFDCIVGSTPIHSG
jgi:hypothetical protein